MKRLSRKGFVEWLDMNAKLVNCDRKGLYEVRHYEVSFFDVMLEVTAGEIVVYGVTSLFLFSKPKIEVGTDSLVISQKGKVACIPFANKSSCLPMGDLLKRARGKGGDR